jgi:hypothetical protein
MEIQKMIEYDRLSNKLILRIFGDEMAYNKLSQIANCKNGLTNVKTIIENDGKLLKVWFNNQFMAEFKNNSLLKTLESLEHTMKQTCRECKSRLAANAVQGEDGWKFCGWKCKRLWFLRPTDVGIAIACDKCGDQIDCTNCEEKIDFSGPLICEECFEYDRYVSECK